MKTFNIEFIKQNITGFNKYVSHNTMKNALEVIRLNSSGNEYTNLYISYGISVAVCLEDDSVVYDFIIKEEDGLFVVYEMSMDTFNKYESCVNKNVDFDDIKDISKDNDVNEFLYSLLKGDSVEVGYRQTCGKGKKDSTFVRYELFIKCIKKLSEIGYLIESSDVIHKNSYATNNGGFWNSSVFKMIKV